MNKSLIHEDFHSFIQENKTQQNPKQTRCSIRIPSVIWIQWPINCHLSSRKKPFNSFIFPTCWWKKGLIKRKLIPSTMGSCKTPSPILATAPRMVSNFQHRSEGSQGIFLTWKFWISPWFLSHKCPGKPSSVGAFLQKILYPWLVQKVTPLF